MKLAVPVWNGRLSPVFDTCNRIRVLEGDVGCALKEIGIVACEGDAAAKVMHLTGQGVDTLICGAITRATEAMASACGITVIAFKAGDVDEVLDAWRDGTLLHERFAMPGCRGRRCRQRRRHHLRPGQKSPDREI
jgi:predicted Fe-Mo cluster-binding NifX family protein